MLDIFIKFSIAVCIIIIAARMLGELMPFIKQPKVVGEMIAGVLLGPTLFGQLFPNTAEIIFPKEIFPLLFVIGNIGLSIYMFIVGMEIDIKKINAKIFKSALLMSASAIILPFIFGAILVHLYSDIFIGENIFNKNQLILYFGTAFAITAFPMLARILQEKNIVETKLGGMMLMSASIQDVVSWILLSFVISFATGGNLIGGLYAFVGCILFILFVKYLIRPILKRIDTKTTEQHSLSQNSFAIIFLILLVCSIITDKIGLYSVFGGFVLGIFMPRNKYLISQIKIRLNDLLLVFFLPIFFTYSGLNANLSELTSSSYLIPTLFIISFGIISKILPIFTTMRLIGYNNNTSLAISGLMNARGLMELIIANIGITYGIINKEAYSVLILLAIISTITASPIFEFSTKDKDLSESD
jgi:Kef-type K+ transport system membrane component KefB